MTSPLRDAFGAGGVYSQYKPWARSRKAMRKVTLTRTETGDEGTFGNLVTDSMFHVYSLELPWRDNAVGKSCIPPGTYRCEMRDSPKHGKCYHVLKVSGRTDVLIHAANWAGDAEKGFKSQLQGCISVGRAINTHIGQMAVLSSRDALKALEDDLDREPFELTVKWGAGIGPS
jgi:hypothetical protein